MKNFYLLIISLLMLFSNIIKAQVVTISDSFKAELITQGFDTNSNGDIEVNEAAIPTSLNLQSKSINDLTGIKSFINLTYLNVDNNQLSNLDVSGLTKLTSFSCNNNSGLTDINASGCIALTSSSYSGCPVQNLNFSGCIALTSFTESNNATLSSLNLSNCIGLSQLYVQFNNLLSSINIGECSQLTYLQCYYNPLLTSLDTSGLTQLTSLYCPNNALTTLNTTGLTALTSLSCNSNQLTSLNTSELTALTTLSCNNNQLTTLNVKGLALLTNLNCNNNQLTALDVSGLTALTYFDCSSNINLTSVNASGCIALTLPNYSSCPVQDLNFSDCIALTSFFESSNTTLTSLNLSNCTELTTISISYNSLLTTLNVNGCTQLATLQCYYNPLLTNLDASGLTQLTSLYCPNNALTTLITTGLTALTSLSCNSNQLTSLNTSELTALTTLSCNNNQLTTLNVKGLALLTNLNCNNNQLTALDVSGLTALTQFNCSNNSALTDIDASGCIALTSSYYSGCPVENLNFSGCIALTFFSESSNTTLTSLNLSNCTGLTYIDIAYNSLLTTLNVNGCSQLATLQCYYNPVLSSLDASGLTQLTSLYCPNNALATLNTTGLTTLTSLNCGNNQLTSLNTSGLTALTSLSCNNNQLASLNATGLTLLNNLSCNNNQLTALDVLGLTALTQFNCSNNSALTDINASGCIALTSSYYSGCPVENLNFTGCIALTSFSESSNTTLTSLNLSNCTGLTYIGIAYNSLLTTLNVNGCSQLATLQCYYNPVLSSLDASGLTQLTSLYCPNNALTTLNTTGLNALTSLECSSNQLTSLNTSELTALTSLSCNSNQLTALDASGLTALSTLNCSSNSIATIDLRNGITNTINLFATSNIPLNSICIDLGDTVSGNWDNGVIPGLATAPTGNAIQTFCNAAKVADLVATGTGIQWYDSPTSSTALDPATDLVNNTTYYASQSLNSCASTSFLEITAIINITEIPTATATQIFCNTGTVSDLIATGTAIQWYESVDGGTALESNTPLTTGIYYATQTLNNCESAATTAVAVTVNPNVTYYADADGDTFGNPAVTQVSCAGQPVGYVIDNTDCNDNDAGIHTNCNNVTYAITCPTDKSVNTDSGYCIAVVNDINPIVTPVDAVYTYALSGASTGSGNGGASGLTFNSGETTITYTLTADVTKTCSFTVTVNGELAGALNFDGINDYVSIPALNLNSNTVTMEAWIKPTGLQGDYDGIVFCRSGSTIAGLGIKANNEIEYHWNNDGLTYGWSSGAIATPDVWSHVVLVVEPTKATIYLNGVAHVNNVTHAIEEFNGITRIGKDDPYLSQDRQFKGNIEEVRIWNRSLCAAEIQNNMAGELTLPQSGLLAYYKFNQGFSACSNTGLGSLSDSSGNNLNGTLTNFVLTGSTSNWVNGHNSGASSVFEHTPPLITCPTPISVSIDAPNTTAIVNFVATATDDSEIASITYSKDPNSEFPIGTTEVIVTVTDNNCNVSTCSFTVTVLENVNPQIHWVSISTVGFHSIGIKNDGTIWAWGYNYYGQLGDGTTIDKNVPVQIGAATNWKSISAGRFHNGAIKTDGTLWAWGLNGSGQLGDGTNIDKNTPIQIGDDTNWQSISAGENHTVGVKINGTLWAWGSNAYGQLGDGTNINKNAPVQIGTDTNWMRVAAGQTHTAAIKTDGTLWAWGSNAYGQLGDGTNINNSPVQIGTAINWKVISTGYSHTVGIKTDGTLWTWGNNLYGQLGDGTNSNKNAPIQIGTETNWQSISAGGLYTVGIKTDGTLWSWGLNGDGQLGDGTNISKNIPLQIGIDTNWQSISTGDNCTIGIKTGGQQFCGTGYNGEGGLGDGTNIDKNSFICIPTFEPYTITCSMDKIVNTDIGYCTAMVNSIDPVVTPIGAAYGYTLNDATTGSGNGSASGLNFNKGETTITYTMVDDITKTCSFKVTVLDAENPTIVCAPDVTINTLPGLCTGTTTLINPTVTDNNCNNFFGNALNFDGLNDNISIGNTNLPTGNSARTVTAWIQTTKTSIGNIISYGNGSNGENFNVGISNGSVFVSSWADPQYFVPASNVNNGSWHHVAVSFDGTNAQTYVDGILLDDRVFTINTVLNTAKIGTRRDAQVEFFEGSIDELSIWNVALTQSQIQANMNTPLSPQTGIVVLYHFNQGTAGGNNSDSPGPAIDTAIDTSGNVLNGTLSGFTLTGSTSNWVSGNVGGAALTVTNDAPAIYPKGNTIVTWTATDASNNTAICTQTVTVIDAEIPTIVCAPDVTINTSPGQCTGATTLINPTVSDNCNASFGNALNFDGGYVDVPHGDLLNPIDQLTIETWVKRTSNGLQQSLIEKYTSQADSFGYLLRISPENKAFTMVLNYDGPQLTGATSLLPNVWYHLASTFNRTTGVLKLYVNGVLDGQISDITGLPVTPSTGSLKIGARGDDAAIYSNDDLMDEVRIWNIERTQAQIQADMNNELNAQPGLVALYHYNQGVALGNNSALPGPAIDTATDDSGNGFNGTLINFTLTSATSNWVAGNAEVEAVDISNDAPDLYPIGNTTVTWTATDSSNNTTTCTQSVTVVDAEIPTIVCTYDITINNTPGQCTGTVILIPPTVSDNCNVSFGNALNFDGGYVEVPHNDLLNPLNELTIETWVKRTSNGLQESLIEKYANQENTFGYLLRITNDNKAFTMVLNGSFSGTELTGSTTILPNVWYHLAATFNRNTGVLKLYVNGVLDGQITGISGLPTTPGAQSLKIGARGDDAGTRLTNGGLVDEARIWNVERSQAQIQADMNNELSAQAGLVALYHFNQGIAGGNNSGSPGPAIDAATDDSGNGFNGTLNGFTLTGPTSNWAAGYIAGGLISLTNDAPVTYPIGNTTVTWTATDESNNTATCTQTVTVVDAELPYITAPTELHYTRTANSGLCFYDIDGGEFDLAATDNCQLISFFYSMVNVGTGLSSTAESLSDSSLAEGINIISWTATDINGNSSTISFEVEVLKGDITVVASESEICNGENSVLTVSGATSYSWSPSTSLSSSIGASVIATPTQTTTYTVTGTGDIAGCSVFKEIIITVTPLPVVTLGIFSPVCVNTAPFVLNGGLPLGGTYSGTGVSSGSFNPSIAGLGIHTITYIYTDGNGCINSATSSIQVNGPTANAGPDATVYIGYTQTKCTTLSGSGSGGVPPYKYLWNTGAKSASINVCPTVTTTYTLRVTDAQGCFQTDEVIVSAVDITCAKNSVYVCHNNTAICIKTNDVKAHLAHGDYLGACLNAVSFAKGMDDTVNEGNDTFFVYPNPTSGSFTVEVYRPNDVELSRIQILNLIGQVIYSEIPIKKEGHIQETIELYNISEGLYYLQLITGDKIETKKIIFKN